MTLFRESDLKAKQILEGITLRAVSGEKTMMTFFDFEPDAVIPSHKHHHEQITYVIEGEMEFTVERETRILKKGEGVARKWPKKLMQKRTAMQKRLKME